MKKASFEDINSPLAAQKPNGEPGPSNDLGFPVLEVPDPLGFLPSGKSKGSK